MALARRHFMISGAAALAAPGLALPGAAQGYQIALPEDLPQSPGTIITQVATSRPQVALTFDDGPHHSLTPALLDILAARGVRATFYVIGNRVARHAAIMQRIVAEGHEIGNHTWSHPSLYGYGDTAFLSEIDRTNQVIYDTVGRPPVTMRPPYGNITARQAALLYNMRNMATVLWSVDPQDWMRPGSSVVVQRIVNGSHPGAVVLSHDIHGPTVRAMPATIDGLAARGLECVTLSELMGWPRWDRRNLRLAGQS